MMMMMMMMMEMESAVKGPFSREGESISKSCVCTRPRESASPSVRRYLLARRLLLFVLKEDPPTFVGK